MKFSANLGFLWNDRSLPDAIRAAKAAGFDAVECHWPYQYDTTDVKQALQETGLAMLGINTHRGDAAGGDNGLSALPSRIPEAVAAIDQAIEYAGQIGAKNIHVMAGFSLGTKAHDTFLENLIYACSKAVAVGITILIEPLNKYDAPGYFLSTAEQAEAIIAEIDQPNLKLMFDCYHLQLMGGDLTNRLKKFLPIIGHIQFASVPDRGTPDHGEVNYHHVFKTISAMGYDLPLGAEYKPETDTDQTLNWLRAIRSERAL